MREERAGAVETTPINLFVVGERIAGGYHVGRQALRLLEPEMCPPIIFDFRAISITSFKQVMVTDSILFLLLFIIKKIKIAANTFS